MTIATSPKNKESDVNNITKEQKEIFKKWIDNKKYHQYGNHWYNSKGGCIAEDLQDLYHQFNEESNED